MAAAARSPRVMRLSPSWPRMGSSVAAVRPEVDLLARVETFQLWLAEEGERLGEATGAVDLRALRALRGHVAVAVEAARRSTEPSSVVLAALSRVQRAAPAYRVLGWDGERVAGTWRRDGDATQRLATELAVAAADMTTDPSVLNVRRCEGPQCRLLFLPAHPRRRWSSPALCANRVRVARYYERHKAQPPDAPPIGADARNV
jgi:predicted RNA-binding Zn ribbon-like protein